jgi:RNA polymerase sigma-70 factor (ECF subfamily)
MNFERGDPGDEARDLVERIGLGDREAEDHFVRRYAPQLRFILRRHVREPSLAEDLSQEALWIVLTRLRTTGLDDPTKLAAFLHQTAINLARGEARKHFRRNTHPDQESIARQATAEPLLADRLEQLQLASMIDQLLDELSQPRDRELLRRHYLGEESKARLCEALSVTPAHFDRILHRARVRFRQLLALRVPHLEPR